MYRILEEIDIIERRKAALEAGHDELLLAAEAQDMGDFSQRQKDLENARRAHLLRQSFQPNTSHLDYAPFGQMEEDLPNPYALPSSHPSWSASASGSRPTGLYDRDNQHPFNPHMPSNAGLGIPPTTGPREARAYYDTLLAGQAAHSAPTRSPRPEAGPSTLRNPQMHQAASRPSQFQHVPAPANQHSPDEFRSQKRGRDRAASDASSVPFDLPVDLGQATFGRDSPDDRRTPEPFAARSQTPFVPPSRFPSTQPSPRARGAGSAVLHGQQAGPDYERERRQHAAELRLLQTQKEEMQEQEARLRQHLGAAQISSHLPARNNADLGHAQPPQHQSGPSQHGSKCEVFARISALRV